jgi:hypothetical protein
VCVHANFFAGNHLPWSACSLRTLRTHIKINVDPLRPPRAQNAATAHRALDVALELSVHTADTAEQEIMNCEGKEQWSVVVDEMKS